MVQFDLSLPFGTEVRRTVGKPIDQLRDVVPILALLRAREIVVVVEKGLELHERTVAFQIDVVVDVDEMRFRRVIR